MFLKTISITYIENDSMDKTGLVWVTKDCEFESFKITKRINQERKRKLKGL